MKGKLHLKQIFIFFALFEINISINAQVGIGILNPDNSAQLDITSLNKGLLVPRLSLIQTTSQSPIVGEVAKSLLVYNIQSRNDVTPGFYYWEGTKWVRIVLQSDPLIFNETLTTLNYNASTNELTYKDEKGISNMLQLVGQTGPQGPPGPVGLTGPVGPQGIQGVPGNDGAVGVQGPTGLTGPMGPAGPQGIQGVPGNNGTVGPQGPIGPAGPQGIQGVPGNDGAVGPQGGIGLIIDGVNTTVSGSGTTADPYKIDTPSIPVTTVSNTSVLNSLNTTVNGVTGPDVNIINSNLIEAQNGNLVSTINGVASTAVVPVVIDASNGLTVLNGTVQLGGALIQPTVLTASKANTLAVSGLQAGAATDNIIVSDPATGVLKTIASSALNTNNWALTGNTGTNTAANFLGTTDNVDLIFKRDNVLGGRLGYTTSFGVFALSNDDGTTGNTAFGVAALNKNTSGRGNVGIGEQALYNNIDGYYNLAMGQNALFDNISGSSNVGIGSSAAFGNTTGEGNIGIGQSALSSNTTGNNNIAIGNIAISSNSGDFNIGIGFKSGSLASEANNCIYIGGYSEAFNGNQTNEVVIGHSAKGRGTNTVQIGNSSMTSIGGQVAWSNPSDARLKKDIVTSTFGLNFIHKLRPVTYKMKTGTTELQSGFIAQEVETAAKAVGYEFSGIVKPRNDNDFYSLRYSEFVVPLVKAVQEQQSQIEKQQTQIKQQQKDIEELKQMVQKLAAKQFILGILRSLISKSISELFKTSIASFTEEAL